MPGLVSASSSAMNSRSTISRITSRGVKCSPAVSFDSSAKLPDQFLEDQPHVGVARAVGVQIDLGELLDDLIEQVRTSSSFSICFRKSKRSKMSRALSREGADVGDQVLADVVRVCQELLEVERRRVVEGLLGLPDEEVVQGNLLALPRLRTPSARPAWSPPARSPAGAGA